MEGLKHLLDAPSKKSIQDAFLLAFSSRKDSVRQEHLETIHKLLGLQAEPGGDVLQAMKLVIMEALYHKMNEQQFERFLGDKVQSKLKEVISKIVMHYLPEWRDAAVNDQPTLPKLQSIDWRIDLKSASDKMTRISVPSVIVQLEVDQPNQLGATEAGGKKAIQFELGREALDVILDDLRQIKQQLASL